MKKVTLLFLCLAGLYSETNFFLGLGGGYGAKTKVSTDGDKIALEAKYYNALHRDFLKAEGVVGFETIFSSLFGIRYYANLAQASLIAKKDERLADLELGLNFDLLFRIPVNDKLALRIYTGVNTASHKLQGPLMDNIKKFFNDIATSQGNNEVGYKDGFSTTSLNLGLHLLFLNHHVVELGSRVLLTKPTSIFYLRGTTDPNEPRSNLYYQTPKVEFLAKYIYVF